MLSEADGPGVLDGTDTLTAAYLDDVVIYSTTWGQPLQHLGEVLCRIHKAGLMLQPK